MSVIAEELKKRTKELVQIFSKSRKTAKTNALTNKSINSVAN